MGNLVCKGGARALACSATDGAPARFPGYVLERRIGRGGMGATVYLARQISTGARVAIKVLPEEFAGDAVVARRFARETRVMASVCCSNVVRILDAGTTPEADRYIVMEYVESGSLAEALANGIQFEPDAAARLVADICRALTSLHCRGIIHRDIKPSNILLDPKGNPKVGDLGLARRLVDASGSLTGQGDVIGTYGYLAPEQSEGRSEVDTRADIFALGVVFYRLLAGSLPCINARPPSAVRRDTAPYDAVVMKALETDPCCRFGTAQEFRRALLDAPQLNRRRTIRRIVFGGLAVLAIIVGAWGVWRAM